MKYQHESISNIIPNRYPLMFLDSLEVDEGKAVAFIELQDSTWFFPCHYPDNPVMPMTLLIESMTQTFSATFLSMEGTGEIPVIASISGSDSGPIKIRESAVPGDTLRLEAKLHSFRRGVAKGICKAYKNDGQLPIMEIEIVDVLPSGMVRRI